MQHSSFHKPAVKKHLSALKVRTGHCRAAAHSGALTAGKYVSQRSTESRSQAAGGQRYIVCPISIPT